VELDLSYDIKKSWRKILPGNEAEFLVIDNNMNEAVSETLISLQQITGCENVDEEAVHEWLKADENLTAHEILSDDEMVRRVTNEKEAPPILNEDLEEEDLVPANKISHSPALTHVEALLDYVEQEDDIALADKMMLHNLRTTIRKKMNQSSKQTPLLSFLKKVVGMYCIKFYIKSFLLLINTLTYLLHLRVLISFLRIIRGFDYPGKYISQPTRIIGSLLYL
jgi:hypothetical protein